MIIYPNITKVIKNQEQKTFKISMEGIIKSVRNDMADDDGITPRYYYYDNGKLILLKVKQNEKNEEVKTIGKANASGYIFVDNSGHILINAICNRKYCGYNTEESETIQVKKNTGENQGEFDLDTPLITLKGNEKITLGLGKRYIEYGAVAKTIGGEDISQDIVIQIIKDGKEQETVDTNKAGVYEITYSITHKKKRASVKRTITVIDSRPEIIFTKAESTYVKKKEVTIKIKAQGENTIYNFIYRINDGKEITVTGNQTTISLEETGTYTIFVEATDNKGNKNSKKSDLYKIDITPPELTIPGNISLKAEEVSGYDLKSGVIVKDNQSEVILTIEGAIEAIPGVYTITYKASDEALNETIKKRVITVLETEAPIINVSSNGTDGYTKAIQVTMTATDNNKVKSFTYQLEKDGVQGEVISITENNFSKEISLSSTGIYKLYLVATDIYDNTSTLTTKEYKIDTEIPQIIYKINGNIVEIENKNIIDDSMYARYDLGCYNGTQVIEVTPIDTGGSGVNRIETLMQIYPPDTWDNRVAYNGESITYTANTEGMWGLHTQAWDHAGNNKIGFSAADNWIRSILYIDTSAGTLSVNTNVYPPGTQSKTDVTFTLTGSNTGCEQTKNYYYSINNGDWVYLGSGDTVSYSSSSYTQNMVTKKYQVKFLITDGFGRWGQITDNYSIEVYQDIVISFDSENDLQYFNIYDNPNTGGNLTVSGGYVVQSSTRTDGAKAMVLSPTTFGRNDFSYVEWRSRRESTNTTNQFPFLTIHFSNGTEFRYFMMNTFTASYSSWAYSNLKSNTGNAMWQYASNNMYDTTITNPTTALYGIMGTTATYSQDTTYSILHNKQTGTLTIYDGHLNKTITTKALTTSSILNVDFNLQGDWYNTNTRNYIDYIKVR